MQLRFTALYFFLVVVLSGCAVGVRYGTLNNYMKSGNCSLASGYVEKSKEDYGTNKRLLFYLDSGMVNMLCGKYRKSNQYLHEAEDLAERLWTKSISREAASFMLNDYTIPYAGEDFERALINLFSAINYVMLDKYDDALVECRRLDANLTMFNGKYEEKNVYKEDAFGRYLSGIIYEATGSLDDAFIDYYKAYHVFRDYYADYGTAMPITLVEDLFRVAGATGRLDEIRPELQDYSGLKIQSYKETEGLGKLVLIHFNGISPIKIDNRIYIPTASGPVTLAFPKYRVILPSCRGSRLIVQSESGRITVDTELVEDINRIAVKNLADRKGRIIARTIARAVAKQAAIHLATKDIKNRETRQMARILLNVINTAIEKADKRSWRTLPGEIYMTRVFLNPGRYSVRVRACDGEKDLVSSMDMRAGETRFLLYNTMY